MKRLIIALCILSMFTTVFGQIVDDEIKINDKGVFFEDFKGEYTYTEPQSEIIRIGILLSQGLKENKKSFQYHSKYSVTYSGDTESDGKYNAIIFSIDKDAKVDTIKNVRAILSSFLMAHYEYTQKDADVLSYFLTVYNNVYRGNTGFFAGKYKPSVTEYITEKNAGIDRIYSEWIGQTKIIIPLTREGFMQIPEVLELSDKKVTDRVKTDADASASTNKTGNDQVKTNTDSNVSTNKTVTDETVETPAENTAKGVADPLTQLAEIKEKDIARRETAIAGIETSADLTAAIKTEIAEVKKELTTEKEKLKEVYANVQDEDATKDSIVQKTLRAYSINQYFWIIPLIVLLLILLIFIALRLMKKKPSYSQSGSSIRRDYSTDLYTEKKSIVSKSPYPESSKTDVLKNNQEKKTESKKDVEDITSEHPVESDVADNDTKADEEIAGENEEVAIDTVILQNAKFRTKIDMLRREKISKFQLLYNKEASFIDEEEHSGELVVIESKLSVTDIGLDYLMTTGDIGLYLDEIVELKSIKLRVDNADFNRNDALYTYKLVVVEPLKRELSKLFTVKDSVVGQKKMPVFGQDSAVIDKLVLSDSEKPTQNKTSVNWQDCKIRDEHVIASFISTSQPLIDTVVELSVNGMVKEFFIYKVKYSNDVFECFVR